ncbi:MAG TPA: S8 family peptidase [Oscillatoriaceae cyanobacterium]
MATFRSLLTVVALGTALLAVGCAHESPTAVLTTTAVAPSPEVDVTANVPSSVLHEQPTITVTKGAAAVPDELLVAVKPGTRVVLDATTGPKPVGEFDLNKHYQVVRVPAGMTRAQAIAELQKHTNVLSVVPDRVYNAQLTPNDPSYGSEWGEKKINAQTAWDKHVDASGVTVAVLDTGVDYLHPELLGRVIKGPDLADGTSDPMDHMGHGTHVAGIIGAAGNNGIGVAGVAWNCKILAIKVLGDDGNGTTDTVAQGIKYAADHGARVINMSLGTSDQTIDPVLHEAMDYAHQHGCVICAASGNESGPVGAPANDPNALAVSSTSHFWLFEWCSLYSNTGPKVEVAAPGGGILSTLPSEGSQLGRNYGTLSGTSMATPFVSGEAALIIAQHPSWSADQVRARIDAAVDHKGSSGRNNDYGYGRVDLAKALD